MARKRPNVEGNSDKKDEMHLSKLIRELCEIDRKIQDGTLKNLCRTMLASPDTRIKAKTFPTGNSIKTDKRNLHKIFIELVFYVEGGGRRGVLVGIILVVILIAVAIIVYFCFQEYRLWERESKPQNVRILSPE